MSSRSVALVAGSNAVRDNPNDVLATTTHAGSFQAHAITLWKTSTWKRKLLRNFGFFVWANERDHCLSGQADMPAGHVVHKFAVG